MPTPIGLTPHDRARNGNPTESSQFWRRLLYRWCVEYNPLYLLSAALVLGGCFLLSRGLIGQESPWASLGISLVSEVYAFCLLGGAALLTRIGQRRPGVMLALLFLLYQWDLTLHTETCAYLGSVGAWAAAAWVALFVGKLHGLAWALRVRLAKRLEAAAIVAAVGLAIGPRLIPDLGARHAGALLAVWFMAVGALAGSPGGVESLVELTPWGHTVLRRTTRAGWLIPGALVGGHVAFWSENHALGLSSALPVLPFLLVRKVRSEARVWATVLGTLAFVALALPDAFSVTALLAAAALLLRVLSPELGGEPKAGPSVETVEQPYRSSGAAARTRETSVARSPSIEPAERGRAFAGALFALYLSAWTLGWSGGPWPAHVVALDATLTAGVLLFVWRLRIRSPLVPLAGCYVHLVAQAHLVPAPRTAAEWGALSVGLGFFLLAGSLAASYGLRTSRPPPAAGRRV